MDDQERRQALANFLRTRRERLSPAEVGLPAGMRRRTPGLRREEVALLASIGTAWYISLEQGRDVHPSEQVVESLAQALRLTPAERQYLFLLALQHAPINRDTPEETASPALVQIVQSLNPHPTYIRGRRWDVLSWNRATELVFPGFAHYPAPHTRNMIWRLFSDPNAEKRKPDWDRVAKGMVARFRAESARYPGDPWFAELIEDLARTSERFREWWSEHDVMSVPDCHKEMNHPTLGYLEFEEVTLQVPTDLDLKIVIYTATPATKAILEHALLDADETPVSQRQAEAVN